MLYWIGFEACQSLENLQGSCLSEMKLSVLFDSDLSWQSTLSHTLTLSFSLLLFYLFCQTEMSLCLLAAFEWWGKEETFQPMLVLNPERDKETRPRVLLLCPHLSIPLPFALSTTACKEQKETQNRRQMQRDTFQSTAPKLQNVPPQNAK